MNTNLCLNSGQLYPGSILPGHVAAPRHDKATLSAEELHSRTARLVHELRNPLHGMLGAASLMRFTEAGDGRPSPERLLDIIETSGKHMLRLLGEVIDVALGHEGQSPVRPARVNVRQIVRESLDILEPLAASKVLLLTIDIHPDVPETAVLDPLRIKQVLVNLLGNAIRFTDTGEIAVAVSLDQATSRLRFEVRDTGVGMTEGELFGLLVSLDGTQLPVGSVRRGGSGMGLQISQGILKTMGSTVNMTSTLGSGTRVWFTVDG